MPLGFYWDKLPRAFGNPEQVVVFKKEYLNTLIRRNNGKRPCFITHNAFRVSSYGFPSEIHMSKIFAGDLDNERKPENALLDARKMCRFGMEENHPLAFAYTAGKGFHCYLLLEPEYYSVGSKLKEAIRAIQLYFRGLGQEDDEHQEYKTLLRTHDPKILGDERRLCRVWMTKYVSGSKKKDLGDFKRSENKCCPLTNDMILNWSFRKIEEYSKNPEYIKYDWSTFKSLSLRQFIKKYEIKKPVTYMGKPYDANDGKIAEFTGAADNFILRMFPDRPCIAENICRENPDHLIRFAAVAYLKKRLDMTPSQIFNLLYSRNWIDRDNVETCQYQIQNIFMANNGRGYNPPTCEWFRKNNFCIGFEKCDQSMSEVIPGHEKFDIEEWT